jgi:hypothetical protein
MLTDEQGPYPQTNGFFDPNQVTVPAPGLFTYYILSSILSGPLLILAPPILWIRYNTLRYEFEESGLRMRVGLLFRNETITAYRRIQDFHVASNVLQRWLSNDVTELLAEIRDNLARIADPKKGR